MEAVISKSTIKDKKYKVILDGKTIHFGATGYEDFTTHRDEDRKRLYLARHRSRENWNDPMTAGFWARWLLWNLPTLRDSAKDIEKRFGIKVILK